MMGSAIQRAIFTRLSGLSSVASLVNGIYATIPQPDDAGDAALFPYITIGNDSAAPMDTKTSDGVSVSIQIDVWSRAGNYIEAKDIAQAIYDALQKFDLVVVGANTISCNFASSSVFDDPDGVTKRVMTLFTVTLDEI